MKKILVGITALFFAANVASAAPQIKIGASVTGAEFSGAKATEEHKGVETSETDTLAAAYGSIFVEVSVMDMFSVGLDYIPYAIEGETVSNTSANPQGTVQGTNSASVDINDHVMAYVLVPFADSGVYAKAGVSHASVTVDENMYRGTTYSNEEMRGGHLSLGYEHSFDMLFVRAEAGISEYETVESNSSSNNTRVKAKLGDGVHARLSVGKSF
jgi:hypothetical protein